MDPSREVTVCDPWDSPWPTLRWWLIHTGPACALALGLLLWMSVSDAGGMSRATCLLEDANRPLIVEVRAPAGDPPYYARCESTNGRQITAGHEFARGPMDVTEGGTRETLWLTARRLHVTVREDGTVDEWPGTRARTEVWLDVPEGRRCTPERVTVTPDTREVRFTVGGAP